MRKSGGGSAEPKTAFGRFENCVDEVARKPILGGEDASHEACARGGMRKSPAKTGRAADPYRPLGVGQGLGNVVIRKTILGGVTPSLAVPSSPVKTASRTGRYGPVPV